VQRFHINAPADWQPVVDSLLVAAGRNSAARAFSATVTVKRKIDLNLDLTINTSVICLIIKRFPFVPYDLAHEAASALLGDGFIEANLPIASEKHFYVTTRTVDS
jgi:hypothetical protein